MKKNIVIFMNCHGSHIKSCLLHHDNIKSNYKIDYIVNYKYIGLKTLDIIDLEKIKNADIIIVQY
jgi:hypothetical protein